MEIETIARKLEPLYPDIILKWIKSRNISDSVLKELFDRRIIELGRETFGDMRDRIILSCPDKLEGEINLGKLIYEKERDDVGISRDELLQHMAIFGRAGSGKTNVTFHILKQLMSLKIPFVFFDWKRTVRHLIPELEERINVYTPGRDLSRFPFNPFVVPPSIDRNVYVQNLIDILADAFTLGVANKSIINKAVKQCYKNKSEAPNISEILEEIDKIPNTERTKRWKDSAIRGLESLESAALGVSQSGQTEMVRTLLNENTVLELDGMNQESKLFLIQIVSYWIYNFMLEEPNRERLKLVLIIEEAHNILHTHEKRESIIEMLLRQCREIGIGAIIIDQEPHLISSAVLSNTYTSIFMNLKNPSDVNIASNVCLIDSSEKNYFQILPQGSGIVKFQDRWFKPILVRFPKIDLRKGCINDLGLKRYLEEPQKAQNWGLWAFKTSKTCAGGHENSFSNPVGWGGTEHEYWRKFWEEKLKSEGWEVQTEALRLRGTADILAKKSGRTLAVEIETGKSNATWNIKQNLHSNFDEIFIVCTDEIAFKKVESQIAHAGLLIPERVKIVLQDSLNENQLKK